MRLVDLPSPSREMRVHVYALLIITTGVGRTTYLNGVTHHPQVPHEHHHLLQYHILHYTLVSMYSEGCTTSTYLLHGAMH